MGIERRRRDGAGRERKAQARAVSRPQAVTTEAGAEGGGEGAEARRAHKESAGQTLVKADAPSDPLVSQSPSAFVPHLLRIRFCSPSSPFSGSAKVYDRRIPILPLNHLGQRDNILAPVGCQGIIPKPHLSRPKRTYLHKNPTIWSDRWRSQMLLVRGVLVAAW